MESPFSVNLFVVQISDPGTFSNASRTFRARSQMVKGCSTFSCSFYTLVIGSEIKEEPYPASLCVVFDEVF
jgi:hypothetical protein